jgi:hypothetical protein
MNNAIDLCHLQAQALEFEKANRLSQQGTYSKDKPHMNSHPRKKLSVVSVRARLLRKSPVQTLLRARVRHQIKSLLILVTEEETSPLRRTDY